MRSQARVSAGSPIANWPGCYINVRVFCEGLSLVFVQVKDQLFPFIREGENPVSGLPYLPIFFFSIFFFSAFFLHGDISLHVIAK